MPPHAVSVPRTKVSIEAIIGIKEPEKKESTRKYWNFLLIEIRQWKFNLLLLFTVGTRTISDEISTVELSRCFDSEEREPSQGKEKEKEKLDKYKEKEDRDEGGIMWI